MSGYSIDEIFQFAIQIEENGESFYREMAQKFGKNGDVKEVFLDLASQEAEHNRTFTTMLSRVKSYLDSKAYNEEYFAYIRAFAENALFSEEQLKAETSKIKDHIAALGFAMERELEAVNYYSELKGMVQPEDQEKIEQIISEEKRHYLYLTRVKAKLSN